MEGVSMNKNFLRALLGRNGSSDEIWVTRFDERSAQEFRDAVLARAKESQSEPIVVYIDSYGGYVDSLAKMIETMDEISNPFITVCMGKAMSCAAILLSHGDARFCGRHSRVMIHEVSGGTEGDVHDMHADAVETKRLNKYFMGLLAKNCKISGGYEGLRKLIKARDGREMYMDANESLKFGIIDHVGIPKVLTLAMSEVVVLPEKKKREVKDFSKSKPKSKVKVSDDI